MSDVIQQGIECLERIITLEEKHLIFLEAERVKLIKRNQGFLRRLLGYNYDYVTPLITECKSRLEAAERQLVDYKKYQQSMIGLTHFDK